MGTTFTAEFLDHKEHEVQRQSHFKIHVDGMPEEISFHIRSGKLPTVSFAAISTRHFNEVNNQAGARSFDTLGITVHDAIGFDVEKFFHDWLQEVQNTQTGEMGYAEDYKRTAYITEYSINGDVRSQWEYKGVWPSSVNFGSLSKENVDKKSVDVTLTYDKAWLV